MTARKRPPLRIVDESELRKPAAVSRPKIALTLRRLAEVAEHGSPWSINESERDPICAAMVVVFGPDGEPTPFVLGVTGDLYANRSEYWSLIHDADEALHKFRDMRAYDLPRDQEIPEERYAALHAWWLERTHRREQSEARKAAEAAAHEAAFPFVCECGQRCKSERGLAAHRARGRRHRAVVIGGEQT
jgi:hypothetical protein